MRWVWVVVLLGCGIPSLDGTEKECPCADGYVCDEARNRCVERDAGADDAGTDVGMTDAGVDATIDGGAEDAGDDVGAEDAGDDAGETDSGPRLDAGPRDVGTDVPPTPDAGPAGCPRDGLYCTNFEESPPNYERRGSGDFMASGPGYMSPTAGYYESAGVATFTEFDGVSLPSTFFVRFYFRIVSGSFNTEGAIFGALLPGGSDEGVLVTLQNTSGLITVTAQGTSGGSVSDTYGPPGDVWTCIRLDVRTTSLDLEIDDQGEVSTPITPFAEDYDDVAFGILESGIDESTIVIDEVLVTDSPVPCAVP